MNKIELKFQKQYDCKIIIKKDILTKIDHYLIPLLTGNHIVIITNNLVKNLYGDNISKIISKKNITVDFIEVPDSESSKSLTVAGMIYDELLQLKADRSTVLITLGGGVIGDLGGFIASTFMRGIPFIQIPTTLLAQIDSSIGGKVAIDHFKAKNIIGSFNHPIANFIDPNVLISLPVSHLKNGITEAIKIAIIFSPDFFTWIAENLDKILQKDEESLGFLIKEAAQLKIKTVLEDPWEKNQRHFLNLGHSIGHAIESVKGYETISHGEAVAMGIVLETRIAYQKRICSLETKEKIENIFQKIDILPEVCLDKETLGKYWNSLLLDKKNKNGIIRFVLPEKIGKVQMFQPIYKEDLEFAFNSLR